MATKRRPPPKEKPARWYRGADIPMTVIRRFARAVAEQFQPDKIILFGSYAYGTPHEDSDVDILVIMPARNELDMAAKIHTSLLPPFPMDILVRTPKNLQWRLDERESFHTEIVTKGKVLYEKSDAGMGPKGGGRLRPRSGPRGRKQIAS